MPQKGRTLEYFASQPDIRNKRGDLSLDTLNVHSFNQVLEARHFRLQLSKCGGNTCLECVEDILRGTDLFCGLVEHGGGLGLEFGQLHFKASFEHFEVILKACSVGFEGFLDFKDSE